MQREMPVINHALDEHGVQSILELACSSGRHTVKLAAAGRRVFGIDYFPEAVDLARERMALQPIEIRDNVTLRVDDICKFETLGNRKFDAAIALGNVLALLGSKENLRKGLENTAEHLNSGGILFAQTVNHQARSKQDNRYLPLKTFEWQGTECILQRFYEHEGPECGIMHFNIFARDTATRVWQYWSTNTTPVFPLDLESLKELLGGCGFRLQHLWGTYSLDTFVPDASKDLIFVAVKAD